MPDISVGLKLTWLLAALEANVAGHEGIEPEYLFVGLCKLEDVADPSRLRQLRTAEAETEAAQAEIKALVEFFGTFDLKPTTLRREMRGRTGRGPVKEPGDKQQVMHRSPRSRLVFERADALAGQSGADRATVFHLLAALLEEDQNQATDLLRDLNADPAAIKAAALQQTPPRSVSDADSILKRYGKDLVEEARAGKLHPAVSRKEEMLQVVRTLSRATKNNPLLIGEAGVGKTAVVEGLACRLAEGNVPEAVRGKRIVQVQMADLVAGAKYRGDFEERVQGLVREVAASPDVILFLDEIHTMVGAGQGSGALDAANILKPALARGTLRCIGATTRTEYRQHIEKDPALERRFQPITIDEPTPEATIEILRQGLKPRLEKKHGLVITEEALAAAARLSARYLPDRRLPDKAIDLLDEACARLEITQLSILPRDKAPDMDAPLAGGSHVTADAVAAVLAEWTGIPAARLTEDERERLLAMADTLKKRVIGQDEAVDAVTETVQRARAGLKPPGRPMGVLLFLGSTGVGKTELAKATAAFLFGSEQTMIRLDMSEFGERHQVSRLIGSPPGYVGSEQEGQLTGALRAKPYSVVLLDEIEKAHPDVLNLFLQVFDDGRLTDSKGRVIDAANALFIMTSNLGFGGHRVGFRPQESQAEWEAFMTEVQKALRPEFLNRVDRAVVFKPLSPEDIARIARGMLKHIRDRLAEQGMNFSITDEALALLARQGYDEAYGARPLRRVIEQRIENPLGGMLLRGQAREGQEVAVEARGDDIVIEIKATGRG